MFARKPAPSAAPGTATKPDLRRAPGATAPNPTWLRLAMSTRAGAAPDGEVEAAPGPKVGFSGIEGSGVAVPHRARMEAGLGESFAGVRAHLGVGEPLARIGARAAASGEHVAFASASPEPAEVAHELAHVVQQRRHGGAVQALSEVSQPGDASEREASAAAQVVSAGGSFRVQEAPTARVARNGPPLASGSGWFPSQQAVPPGTPPPQSCFEDASAATAAGAPAAFDKFIALAESVQMTVLSITYASGSLSKALAALGLRSREAKYADAVRKILVWIEQTEARKATGKTDDEMAKIQAGFIKADPKVTTGNWGGVKQTRWQGMLQPARDAWTKRANTAIASVVTYATANAPELKITASTFEFDPDGIDATAKFSPATVGSQPGKTMKINLEFVALAEANPAYVLQFVAHEVYGHPVFDTKGRTYQGDLFQKAAALTPSGTVADPSGTQNYNYYPSEIYSWLLMVPYAKPTAAADKAKMLGTPGNSDTVDVANWKPQGSIDGWVAELKSKWEASLAPGLMRGFYKRVANDPAVKKVSLAALQSAIVKAFGATVAAQITQ